MGKKTSVEFKIENEVVTLVVGTLNKKNPEIIFIEIGCFLQPIVCKEGYLKEINHIERIFKSRITDMLQNNNYFTDNAIIVFNIAKDRMKYGKKSYLSIECHLKTKNISKITPENEEIVWLNETITHILSELLNNSVFSMTKTKDI